ncbi:MAG TPA: hypothetical protein PLK24_00990 [Atribacter sp.]|jgi:metal-sulfur cluster biosynthetic enzyme|nr:hypothetical protein [Atribacter sp.]MDD3713645.1 hypothetical protein [Atribacterota bacterium]MDI9594402.1 hypothetical protein [Atribacterota bacterium]HOT05065.1 hypothetical protein [Atribacter sp.]HQK82495.1 hypothetical protein [Atribacter sp.]
MKVYALVGPTGTGKSYRAPHIAQRYGIDCIIDDGLLISQGSIIAGKSSKAEVSKIKAAKIAVFYFTDHRQQIIEALKKIQPPKIMILGISLAMVEKICERLQLPYPSEIVMIEDIASPEEIENALQARIGEGKHTIPVPLVELKRNLWGNIVDTIPVKVWGWFYSSREKTVVRPPFSYLGKLVVSESALRSIILVLLTNLPWIKKINDIFLHKVESHVNVRVGCVFKNYYQLVQICAFIQKYLKEKVEHLSGVELIEVNIDIDQIAIIKNGEIVEKRTTKVKKSSRSERTRISSSRK